MFLFALYLPAEKVFGVNSSFLGPFVITLPILVLFIARAIDGITGGNISVANAYLSDISSNENRSKNFGKMAISSNLGFIVGPAIAGILGATIYGAILPVLAALLLSLITLFVLYFMLKETKPASKEILVPEEGTIRKVFAQECKDCYDTPDTAKSGLLNVFKTKAYFILTCFVFSDISRIQYILCFISCTCC